MVEAQPRLRVRHLQVAKYDPGADPETDQPTELVDVWLDAEGQVVTDPEAIRRIKEELGWA